MKVRQAGAATLGAAAPTSGPITDYEAVFDSMISMPD